MATDTTAANTTSSTVPSTKTSGQTITADTFNQMIDLLDSLVDHSHTFTDDWTSNCQCNCGRGSL